MDSATPAAADERVQLLGDVEGIGYGTQNQQQQQQDEENPPADGPADDGPADDGHPEPLDNLDRESDRDTMIERLTLRLRCLFSAITWPIVPLGTLVSLCLIWVMYSAFAVDAYASCSHPLHAYALASMCFLMYAPYHAQIRTFLFRYSRERDGPNRPTRVRLYDQLFHTLCILYVYGGVTLIQSCKQDVGEKHENVETLQFKSNNHTITAGFSNTCDATCPHLYAALDVYVTMLELFTLSLILPLLFLPCIYLWILRRASTEAETFWHESLEDSDDLFGRRPRVSAQELMDSLESVKLVRRGDTLVIQSTVDATESSDNVVKDCCICMSDFTIHGEEMPQDEEAQPAPPESVAIVRTKCGHVFHETCLGGWIGGRWDPQEPSSSPRRRTRRTCCPLCREDLQPSSRTSSRTRSNNVELASQ